jgi:hypothetical protein
MSGSQDNDNSLVNGAPARFIGPETGSFGDATMTDSGETSAGTNSGDDSLPAPAAGLDRPVASPGSVAEPHGAAPEPDVDTIGVSALTTDEESIAQQIADGQGHIKHGQKLHERLHKG